MKSDRLENVWRSNLQAVSLLCLLGWLVAMPARAQSVANNFCWGNGTCDIATPNFVNVYWDSSLAQWDTDVAATTTDMHHANIDALTEAIVRSQYFSALTQYSVTSVTMGQSIGAGGCLAAPATLDKAREKLQDLANCILKHYPSLNNGNTILNVFVPPQSMPASNTADFCTKYAGEHGQYWTPVGITFLPTSASCNKSLDNLMKTTTHEMIEAATDPNPPSPTGWKDNTPGPF